MLLFDAIVLMLRLGMGQCSFVTNRKIIKIIENTVLNDGPLVNFFYNVHCQ
jgi:hypothetical protein